MATTAGNRREIAARYATALFELGRENDTLSPVKQEVEALRQLITDSDNIQRLLTNPLFDAGERLDAITQIVQEAGFSTPVQNFARVIVEEGRGAMMADVCDRLIEMVKDHQGIVHVHTTTAKPLTDEQKNDLITAMKAAGKSDVTVANRVDPSILSGLIVKIGSTIMDDSGRSKLSRLQTTLEQAA
jgi:F-type H+-transporting ATPase subunit delta